jgi:hypothetical protein
MSVPPLKRYLGVVEDGRCNEFRAAVQERGRSKLGRMARLPGVVETLVPRQLDLEDVIAATKRTG